MNRPNHEGVTGSQQLGEAPIQIEGRTGNLDAEKIGPKTGPSGQGGRDLITDTADSRFRPEGSPDAEDVNSTLARDVAAGMLKNQQEVQAKGQALQDMYDAFEAPIIQDNIFNEHFDRNQAEYIPSIRDVTDARPMNRANAAADANISNAVNIQHPAYAAHQNRLENLFQNQETGFPIETRGSFAGSSADLDGAVNAVKTGISGKGGQTSIFNEQENYEVPGDSLTNGLILSFEAVKDGDFSVDGSGTDRVKAEGEEAAWDNYYDYKRAG